MRFLAEACDEAESWRCEATADAPVSGDVARAIAWEASKSPEEVIRQREAIISRIERQAKSFVQNGRAAAWRAGAADGKIERLISDVNGPLLDLLLREAAHKDVECCEAMRRGFPLLGELPFTHNGSAERIEASDSAESLREVARVHNEEVISSLRGDPLSAELFKLTQKDADLGRMTALEAPDRCATSRCRFAKRIAVQQGMRADGTVKVRAVDDLTRSGTNACTEVTEKLSCDGVDTFVGLLRAYQRESGVAPHIYKADIDSAYRRLPLRPEERWAATSVFLHDGTPVMSSHIGLPFGATASVHGWNRIGAALLAIAHRVLFLPMARYVDDFFAASRAGTADHAMWSFARLVRAVLGESAIAETKLEVGPAVTVLGIVFSCEATGVALWPSPDKLAKWRAKCADALASGTLTAGDASKLAGALSWANQCVWHRMGRCMLRPLFAQQYGRRAKVGVELRLALSWWLRVFNLNLRRVASWSSVSLAHRPTPAVLLADAASHPERLAAVFVVGNEIFWTDAAPPRELTRCFVKRSDSQIMALELAAISLGLSTFAGRLAGWRAAAFSDGVGAECALRSASAH